MYLDNCTYKETFEDGTQWYAFTGKCIITGENHTVKVKGPDLYAYRQGMFVQDAFPYLSAGDREFIISGTSPNGWKKLYGGN